MTIPSRRATVAATFVLLAVAASLIVARVPFLERQLWWSTSEQLDFGLFPHHLTSGLEASPPDYLPEPQEGCALIWGVTCAPIFSVAGPTRGSLRWCSLLWHAAMATLFALLALEASGLTAALLVGALWALAPPGIVDAAHFGWVTHVDAGLLTAACLFCLARASTPRRQSPRWLAGCGVLGGLAFYFYFSTAMVLGGLVVTALMLRRVGTLRSLKPALLGLLVGLTPFLGGGGYWAHSGGRASLTRVLGGMIGITNVDTQTGLMIPAHSRAARTVTHDLPHMLGFIGRDDLGAPWISTGESTGTFYLLALTAIALLTWPLLRGTSSEAPRRAILLATCLAIPAHIAGCIASGFDLSQGRYLLPVWAWITLLCAVGGGEAFKALATSSNDDPLAGTGLAKGSSILILVTFVGVFALTLGDRGQLEDLRRHPPTTELMRAFADGQAGYQLAEHPLGRIHLANSATTDWSKLLARHPQDRADLLRVRGWALGSSDPESPGFTWMVEGMAEELARSLAHSEARPTAVEVVMEVTSGPLSKVRPHWAAVLGSAAGASRRDITTGQERWRRIASATDPVAIQRALCVAFGLFAQTTHWTYGPLQEVIEWCPAPEFAAGFGIGLARAMRPSGAPPSNNPELSWWTGEEVSTATNDAFACTFAVESARLASLVAETWQAAPPFATPPWEECLPVDPSFGRPSAGSGSPTTSRASSALPQKGAPNPPGESEDSKAAPE